MRKTRGNKINALLQEMSDYLHEPEHADVYSRIPKQLCMKQILKCTDHRFSESKSKELPCFDHSKLTNTHIHT